MVVKKEALLNYLAENKLDTKLGISWFDNDKSAKVSRLHTLFETIDKYYVKSGIKVEYAPNKFADLSHFVNVLYNASKGDQTSENFLKSIDQAKSVEKLNEAIDKLILKLRSVQPFNDKLISFYTKYLSLSSKAVSMMKNGEISYQRIQDAAKLDVQDAAKRIMDLDCYAGEGDVEGGNPEFFVYMLTQFHSDGVFLIHNGKDVGYSLIYPVAMDYHPNADDSIVEGKDRVKWHELIKYLNEVTGRNFLLQNLHHQYDYVIKSIDLAVINAGTQDPLRNLGFGRLISKLACDLCLSDDN